MYMELLRNNFAPVRLSELSVLPRLTALTCEIPQDDLIPFKSLMLLALQ